jgi:hypothetical protein
MKSITKNLIGAAAVLAFAGCASQPLTLSSVGPAPAGVEKPSNLGSLQVFTDLEQHQVGGSTYYYPHASYEVYSRSGVRVKIVENHRGPMDETPTVVDIPAGQYTILGPSANHGNVRVPVTVATGKTTVIHLDGYWKPEASAHDQVVYFPNGEAIGWRDSVR